MGRSGSAEKRLRWTGVGDRLGDYVVEELIGRGGMGVVFRGRHAVSGRAVALKLMAPELIENEDYRARFLQEARFAPQLDHPHIVPVYESGEVAGELFIAMRLVQGPDLKELLKREGPFDPKRAILIFRQAASALDAAHEAGLVHLDVKPQNVLVEPADGGEYVYVTDFGLVRPSSSEVSSSRGAEALGTVPYMSPEVIEGLPADGRADVYALGCMLYECLTGLVPYERANDVACLWAHVHEDPPRVTDKRRDLPGGIDDVVIRALSKHPDDRQLTCGELVVELEEGLGRRLSRLRARARPLVARTPRKQPHNDIWSPTFFPELSRLRTDSKQVNWWKVVAFLTACLVFVSVHVAREGGIPQVVSDAVDGARSTGEAFVDALTNEPSDDPRRRAVDRDRRGEPREKATTGKRPQVGRALEPRDGQRRDQAPLARPPAPAPQARPVHNGPIVYESRTADGAPSEIVVAQADASGARSLRQGEGPDWSPDRESIVFSDSSGNISVMATDGAVLRRLTDDALTDLDPAWSPDGSMIVFETASVGLRIVAADGSGTAETLVAGLAFEPQWSPDGAWIAFRFRSEAEGNNNIWLVDRYGKNLHRLTRDPGWEGEPTWSPDGRSLAYVGCANRWSPRQDCRKDIFTITAETGDVRRITHTGDVLEPTWAPDGKKLMFSADQTLYAHTEAELWVAEFGRQMRFIQLTFSSVRSEESVDWAAL